MKKMISRRNFLKVAGAGAAAMGLAACGGSSSSSSSVAASSTAANAAADTLSGTIEYWSSWSETENQALVLKQAADAFTQLHPNVKINFTFNGRDNRNLVVSAIEAGTQIDLMDANIDNVQKLWSENIKDLSSYIDKTYDTTNGKAYKDVVIPSMISLAGSLFDGKTMCIPFLFGVDFEGIHGFFVEKPLSDPSVYFTIGTIGHYKTPLSPIPEPRIKILHSSFETYQEKFRIVHQGLSRGDSFLLNLTERTPIETNLTLEQIFYHSQARYKLLLPDRLVCFSPESFVRIENNEILSYPMKGTIDATLPDAENRLLQNHKETCEHYTIVDLIRNDLNIVATRVQVKRFRYVEKIHTSQGEILQTSSEISGQLPDGWQNELGTLLFKLLPAGSISGAPKAATQKLIRQAEGLPRGYYSGVFGYFDGQTLDSAVLIRFIEKVDNRYYFRSGGGITVNSQAKEEYQEILEKIYLPIQK